MLWLAGEMNTSNSPKALTAAGGEATGASCVRSRLKGLRRRAAKITARIDSHKFTPPLPPHLSDLVSSPSGLLVLQHWRNLLGAYNGSTGSSTGNALCSETHCAAGNERSQGPRNGDRKDGAGTETPGGGVMEGHMSNSAFVVKNACRVLFTSNAGLESAARTADDKNTQSEDNMSKVCQQVNTATNVQCLMQQQDCELQQPQNVVSLHVITSVVKGALLNPDLKHLALAAAAPSGLLATLCSEICERSGNRITAWDPLPSAAQLLLDLVELEPFHAQALLAGGHAVLLIKGAMRALDRANSNDPISCDVDSQTGEIQCLTCILKVLSIMLQPCLPITPTQGLRQDGHESATSGDGVSHDAAAGLDLDLDQLIIMREHTVGYIAACGIVHRLSDMFSLCDQPTLWRSASTNGSCQAAAWPADVSMLSSTTCSIGPDGYERDVQASSCTSGRALPPIPPHVVQVGTSS